MDPMTVRELVIWMADEFHDWIDGDDPVEDYRFEDKTIKVRFESGATFTITVKETDWN